MDTHSVPSSSKQPSPWPYTDPSSFHGSPCPNFPKDTTCWDASAVRLDNPGSADVTGVGVVVTIGTRVYNLWGSNLTVKTHGTLVLTETGSQNSTNFDGSDYPPNAYNGGNTASCANSGAIPNVQVSIAGSTTPVATGVSALSFTDTSVVNGTTYYYRVAAVNSVGVSAKSGEASATPQAPSTAGFVRRVASATASTSKTTISLPVAAPGVTAGHTLVVSLLLSSTTSLTGTVSAQDTAGNSYVLARDVNDGSAGDRSVVLVGINVRALAAGATITLNYPSSAETHITADEFAGVTAIDTSAGASATTTSFSSGTAPATSQANEILIGSVGTESGAAPAWSAGWTPLPTLSITSDYLDTAYRIVTSTGAYAATGTIRGQWMASIITLKTS
jgi:hypothetical protein